MSSCVPTLVLLQKDVHRSFTPLFCCSLPQLFICSSIPEFVASSFCLWPQHKHCGCTGHNLMTCSALVEAEPSASLGSFLRLFSSWVAARTTQLPSEKGNANAHPDIVITDSSQNWWYNEAVQKNLPFLFPPRNKSKHNVSEVIEFSSREQSTISIDISQNSGLLCCLHQWWLFPTDSTYPHVPCIETTPSCQSRNE